MAIRDILVQVDAGAPSGTRLDVAVELARQHGAQLIGLHCYAVEPLALPGVSVVGAGIGGGIGLSGLMKEIHQEMEQAVSQLEERFRERLRREGIDSEWRVVERWSLDEAALHARYADLVVLGQEDPAGPNVAARAAVEEALLSSGRPVLLVPYAGRFREVGRRVLVAWNASREAARAVHDALPLMQRAEMVTVLAIDPRAGPDGGGEEPAADLARHLARHGLRVCAERTVSDGLDPADVLLSRAADIGADLIVAGGYGHSRIREVILGGVTQSLLRRMTVPVLLSH